MCEKPSHKIFEEGFLQAKFWIPDLEKHQVLHIGDSLECDYCGARAYGFMSLHLDRSGNKQVTKYQDWVEGPFYDGKTVEDIQENTVKDFYEVKQMLSQSPQFQ
jgi:FMN phosphatase YigB (HAD superfamily)